MRSIITSLTPTSEASGPHDFARRKITRSSVAHPRPSHPDLTSVTIAKRPFVLGRDASDIKVIWVKSEWEYFCEEDWTTQIRLISFNKSNWSGRKFAQVLRC